jgi:hypothetical protein
MGSVNGNECENSQTALSYGFVNIIFSSLLPSVSFCVGFLNGYPIWSFACPFYSYHVILIIKIFMTSALLKLKT